MLAIYCVKYIMMHVKYSLTFSFRVGAFQMNEYNFGVCVFIAVMTDTVRVRENFLHLFLLSLHFKIYLQQNFLHLFLFNLAQILGLKP